MIRQQQNSYRRIVIIVWAVVIAFLWIQRIYLSSLPGAGLFLLVFIPTILETHILSDKLLPRAIQNKRMRTFWLQFILTTLLTAVIWAGIFRLFKQLESLEAFAGWKLVISDNPFLLDTLFSIPSIVVFNLGFCGLRFYFEHISLQRIHLETQVQALQAQINPHFMFNVLNHIHILMQTNVALASSLLLQYSDMLRYQLYKGKNDRVKLREELEFLQNFIEIEKLRWGRKVKVETTWEVRDENVEIPPLLLISFIENAFKYASRTLSGQGYVAIMFRQNDEGLSLETDNSKPTALPQENKNEKETASGIGLANTRQRLELLYGGHYRLDIRETDNSYHSKLEIWKI